MLECCGERLWYAVQNPVAELGPRPPSRPTLAAKSRVRGARTRSAAASPPPRCAACFVMCWLHWVRRRTVARQRTDVKVVLYTACVAACLEDPLPQLRCAACLAPTWLPVLTCRDSNRHSLWLQDESRQGLTYFHETIYSGLPVFLRRIDTALKNIGQPALPLDAKLFSFGAGRVTRWH